MNYTRTFTDYNQIRDYIVGEVQLRTMPFRRDRVDLICYRGHSSSAFTLTPNLARFKTDPVELEKSENILIQDFHEQLHANNKQDVVQLHEKPINYQNHWGALVQAQHFRLPTRFLDWTINWEVALFFAVEDNPLFNDKDADFWVFAPPSDTIIDEGDPSQCYNINPAHMNGSMFLNPIFFWTDEFDKQIALNRRLLQHGRFFVQDYTQAVVPLEKQDVLATRLERYKIPAASKPSIRKALSDLNYTSNQLYYREDEDVNRIVSTLRTKYKL